MKKISRRRRLVVQPKFQLSFLLASCGAGVLSSLVLVMLNMARMVSDECASSSMDNPTYWLVLAGALAAFTGSLVGALVISNRIAGPVHRLKRHMESLARGEDPGPLKFRKNDFLVDLEQPYAQLLEKLRAGNGKSAG